MAASRSPLKRAVSPLLTRAMGTGVLVGVAAGKAVRVGAGPGVFVAEGEAGEAREIRLQPVRARPRASSSSERRLRLMAVFILAIGGSVKRRRREKALNTKSTKEHKGELKMRRAVDMWTEKNIAKDAQK